MSLPTTSDAFAMLDYPQARARERDTLLDMVHLAPGDTVVDLQAAGGYVADEIHRRLAGRVRCICVEPSEELRQRISPVHEVRGDPLDELRSIGSETVDVVVGLAGLHHSPSMARTVAEAARVLRPEGEFGVCDVEDGSRIAGWLNDFVNAYNPSGHHGVFPKSGTLVRELRRAGFIDVRETREYVPWVFASRAHMERFLRGLFGLGSIDGRTLRSGIERHLQTREVGTRCYLRWQLIYAYGRKPGLLPLA